MLRNYFLEKQKSRYLRDLKEYLAIPSISTLPEHKRDIEKCVAWLVKYLKAIGLKNIKAETMKKDGNPVVYGEWLGQTAKPTILIYGHYDVQPTDPLSQWQSPPFEMTIRRGKVFARGATDNKGQHFAHLKAIEYFLKEKHGLPCNIKVAFEGEEEIGGNSLELFIKKHKNDLLKSVDLVLISDGAMKKGMQPEIALSLRGLAAAEIEVFGPKQAVHSGHFGGAIENPATALAKILSQMKDKNQRVTILHFYDDVRRFSNRERRILAKAAVQDKDFLTETGSPALVGEKGFTPYERTIIRPTFEINGLGGGFQGKGGKTIIPEKAFAKITMRLVPNQEPKKIYRLFSDYVKKIVPKGVKIKVKKGHFAKPFFVLPDSPYLKLAKEVGAKVYGKEVLLGGSGWSIPVAVAFKEILGKEVVNFDFGQSPYTAHGPNEYLDLKHFFKGIEFSIKLLEELGKI